MKDRIPTKILSNGARRYGVYDDAGNLLRYEYIKAEDEPTQEGDPLCKKTLLTDDVAAALSLTGNPQVADALMTLALGDYKYAYAIKLISAKGPAIAGATISGIASKSGGSCVTNSNGGVVGFSNSSSVTLAYTSIYSDLQDASATVQSTGTLTSYTMTVANTAELLTITSSKNIQFSRPVVADIHLVGAGHNGEANSIGNGGNGGSSGYQYYKVDVSLDTSIHPAVIGASNGANTTFAGLNASSGTMDNGGIYAMMGGVGGGGAASTTKLFGTGSIVAGGGGGAGGGYYYTGDFAGGSGGSPYGGYGGSTAGGKGTAGSNASGYGGGGGGAGGGGTNSGGLGYQGVLFIRWRYAA